MPWVDEGMNPPPIPSVHIVHTNYLQFLGLFGSRTRNQHLRDRRHAAYMAVIVNWAENGQWGGWPWSSCHGKRLDLPWRSTLGKGVAYLGYHLDRCIQRFMKQQQGKCVRSSPQWPQLFAPSVRCSWALFYIAVFLKSWHCVSNDSCSHSSAKIKQKMLQCVHQDLVGGVTFQ